MADERRSKGLKGACGPWEVQNAETDVITLEFNDGVGDAQTIEGFTAVELEQLATLLQHWRR